MTTDAYGRYVGRHMRFRDLPPGFAIGDPDRPANRVITLGLYHLDDGGDRYDRPIAQVSRAPVGTVTT